MSPSKTNAFPGTKVLWRALLFAMTISAVGLPLANAGYKPDMNKDANVQTSHEFELPAAAVWDLIAGFNTLPDYHAAVPESRLSTDGSVRYLTISEDAGGGTVVERLMKFDHKGMTFSYAIIGLVESPLPFHNYQAWVKLESTGENSCKLYWNLSLIHI